MILMFELYLVSEPTRLTHSAQAEPLNKLHVWLLLFIFKLIYEGEVYLLVISTHTDIRRFCTCAFLGSTCCWSLSSDDMCCCRGEALSLPIQGPEFIYRANGDGRKVSGEIRSLPLLIASSRQKDLHTLLECTVKAHVRTSLTVVFGLRVCFFNRMTMRAALAPPVAVSQTAPRLWPSPVASSRLPLVTRICPQVSDCPE